MRLPRFLRKLRQPLLKAQTRSIDALARRLGRPDAVFLGDSITEFWLEADPWFFWPRRINLGVSGSTTGDMLERFERDVAPLSPRILHVMGGTNDLWYGAPGPEASASLANLIEIAERAKARGMRVILASPPPIALAAEPLFASAALFPVLRASLRQYCSAADVVHVDYAQSLLDEGGVLRPSFTTDGVHLARAGYLAMRQQANKSLWNSRQRP
ncbi:GDSL-type esterase/lipase family protein [Sphingomonas sp. ASY06-1R]|uniref:GDSL-type esterase/lipase family protein n=1 Tax=Sphingomonas sp. ASY06-1R TaxID=3445771 RepID=UPI003FA327DE